MIYLCGLLEDSIGKGECSTVFRCTVSVTSVCYLYGLINPNRTTQTKFLNSFLKLIAPPLKSLGLDNDCFLLLPCSAWWMWTCCLFQGMSNPLTFKTSKDLCLTWIPSDLEDLVELGWSYTAVSVTSSVNHLKFQEINDLGKLFFQDMIPFPQVTEWDLLLNYSWNTTPQLQGKQQFRSIQLVPQAV